MSTEALNTVMEVQEQINNLYASKFQGYEGRLGLSVPHLPRISSTYFINRTVVIGQETNTWYRNNDSDGLKNIFLKNLSDIPKTCLKDRYDTFIHKHARNYGGKFWEFNRLLYKKKILDGQMVIGKGLSHCWLNLFVVEACKNKKHEKGRPTKNRKLSGKIMNMQGDLLFRILEILKPELIISLTGHSLDGVLLKNGIGSLEHEINSIDPNNILKKEMLADIKIKNQNHPLFGTKIIRCYHPSYFMGRINKHKKIKDEIKSCGFQTSVAEYYKKILFDKLNSYALANEIIEESEVSHI
jgi:hypothetical protein